MTAIKADVRSTYTVSYDSSNHWSVLTQMWGSMWPRVLPYCIFNVFMMISLSLLDRRFMKFNIEISAQGHSFLTMVVAFLLISRVNTAVGRFNSARGSIGKMYKEIRELVQNLCVFSSHDTNREAQEWRNEVAYRALLLLRVSMAVIDYPTNDVPAWAIPELRGYELEQAKKCTFTTNGNRRWSHEHRSEWEESMRVPLRMAYLLRSSIHKQSGVVKAPMQGAHENKLLGSVDSFIGGYYDVRTFLTTPVPFPLIQMARTFLFLYVFTVPFVMLADDSGDFAHCFTVFLLTYGFMGLELVAIELDNPFGDDANDFNNLAMAHTAFEDVYMTILEVDGSEWTDNLRAKMYNKAEGVLPSEKSWLLSSVV